MPAKNDKQAIAANIALAVKKGKAKAKPGSPSAKMAKSMSKQQLKDFSQKESVKLLDDVVVETDQGIQILPAGTFLVEMAVTTGNMAFVPTSAVGEPEKKQFKLRKKKDRKKRKELSPKDVGLEENSNSQVSPLQQDH